MFGFKKWRQRKREHSARIANLLDMVQRAAQVLKGWKEGELLIEIPGTQLLEPSTIRLHSNWYSSATLEHRIDGLKVTIGVELVRTGFGYEERTVDDPAIRRLLDLAYDYVWVKILKAEKEKKEADERYVRLRKEAITNMIAHEDSQLALREPA